MIAGISTIPLMLSKTYWKPRPSESSSGGFSSGSYRTSLRWPGLRGAHLLILVPRLACTDLGHPRRACFRAGERGPSALASPSLPC